MKFNKNDFFSLMYMTNWWLLLILIIIVSLSILNKSTIKQIGGESRYNRQRLEESQYGDSTFSDLQKAQQACLQWGDQCRGISQVDSNKYGLRSGHGLVEHPKDYSTWLKETPFKESNNYGKLFNVQFLKSLPKKGQPVEQQEATISQRSEFPNRAYILFLYSSEKVKYQIKISNLGKIDYMSGQIENKLDIPTKLQKPSKPLKNGESFKDSLSSNQAKAYQIFPDSKDKKVELDFKLLRGQEIKGGLLWVENNQTEQIRQIEESQFIEELDHHVLSEKMQQNKTSQEQKTKGDKLETKPIQDSRQKRAQREKEWKEVEVEIKKGKNRSIQELYSGDIINLVSENGNYLQRSPNTSQIVVDKPIPNYGTNLSKLRIESMSHQKKNLIPLKSGQKIVIRHNGYSKNRNYPFYIKYGDHPETNLQSHQIGSMNTRYIIEKVNGKRGENINFGDKVLLSRDQFSNDKYLIIDPESKTIQSGASKGQASSFKVELVRPVQLYDNHLLFDEGQLFP